jgi:DNA-binding SARP family transcriptional activator
LFLQAYQLTQRQRDLIRQAEYFRQTCAVLEQSERSTADKLSALIGSPPDNLANYLNGHGWLQMPLFLKLAPMPFEVPQDNHRFLRGLLNLFDSLRVVRRLSKSEPLENTPINDYLEPINLPVSESLLDPFENGHLDLDSDQETMTPLTTKVNGTQLPFWPEEDQGIPSLVIYCLGPFRVYQNNRYIPDWPSKKAQLVFKYLLTQRQRKASKEVLMETFWPEVEPEAARRSLHQAIYSLRRSLGIINSQYQYVLFENDAYFLDPKMKIWIDCEEFEHRCRSGDLLLEGGDLINALKEYEVAENLYQDHYLSDDLYEDWLVPYRQYLWQMYLRISLSLARSYLERKEYSQAVGISQRILSRDMAQEEAHQIIIRSYLHENQRHLAMRQYHKCVQVFKNEFNLLPSPETRALIQNLVSG